MTIKDSHDRFKRMSTKNEPRDRLHVFSHCINRNEESRKRMQTNAIDIKMFMLINDYQISIDHQLYFIVPEPLK